MRTQRSANVWGIVQSVLILLILVVTGWLAFTAWQTQEALCTFRQDLQTRYDNGVQFLVDHPNGIQGITPADIQRTLESQRSTLDALDDLRCS